MDQEAVGRRVAERRKELRLGTTEAARTAGVDRKTLVSLERGERWPQDSSRSKIEAMLRWSTGALDALTRDEEPTYLADDDAHAPEAQGVPTVTPYLTQAATLHALASSALAAIEADKPRTALMYLLSARSACNELIDTIYKEEVNAEEREARTAPQSGAPRPGDSKGEKTELADDAEDGPTDPTTAALDGLDDLAAEADRRERGEEQGDVS